MTLWAVTYTEFLTSMATERVTLRFARRCRKARGRRGDAVGMVGVVGENPRLCFGELRHDRVFAQDPKSRVLRPEGPTISWSGGAAPMASGGRPFALSARPAERRA
jgi:hypothetical protein